MAACAQLLSAPWSQLEMAACAQLLWAPCSQLEMAACAQLLSAPCSQLEMAACAQLLSAPWSQLEMAACAQLLSAPLNQLDNAAAPQLDSAASAQLLSASPLHPAELSPAAAQLDKTAAAQLESSAGPQLETVLAGKRAKGAKETAFVAPHCSRGKELIALRAAELFLEMLSNACFDLLRAKSAAGNFLEKVTSQKGFKNDALFQRNARRRAGSEKLALLLEPRKGVISVSPDCTACWILSISF